MCPEAVWRSAKWSRGFSLFRLIRAASFFRPHRAEPIRSNGGSPVSGYTAARGAVIMAGDELFAGFIAAPRLSGGYVR